MGNTCCQDESVRKDVSEALEGRVAQRNYSSEFYESDLPADQALLDKIAAIREDQTFAIVLHSHKLMKHKFLDKYYQGKWNSQGEPEGLGIMFEPDQYLYHGEFQVVPSGTGTLQLLKEGLVYEGHLREGRAQGQGSLRSNDGRVQFEGEMLNSMPRSGVLRIINPADPAKSYTLTLLNFPEDNSKIVYGDGRVYEGAVSKRSFAPMGKGMAYFPDGSHYEGEWEQGEMHGRGYFRWKDGTSYSGDYQHGRKHGEGTFTYVSKKRYSGEWAAGRQNGRGRLLDAAGKVLKEGVWREGVLQREERLQA